jgi:hypothetical protein
MKETFGCIIFCLLAWLIFDPEDGGDTFLRNVGSHEDYIAEYGSIHNYSCGNLKSYKAS